MCLPRAFYAGAPVSVSMMSGNITDTYVTDEERESGEARKSRGKDSDLSLFDSSALTTLLVQHSLAP